MAQYLLLEIEQLERRFQQALLAQQPVFFLFDFDGTLAPIAANPESVQIAAQTVEALVTLARIPGVLVGIISGRELTFMERFFPSDTICLVGSHGSEMAFGDKRLTRVEMSGVAAEIHAAVAAQQPALGVANGHLIEAKRFGVALHYRLCDPDGKRVVRKVARSIVVDVPDAHVSILRGKQVAEINPKIGWNKGRAIEDMRTWYEGKPGVEVYIGDDISDEYAFRVLTDENHFSVRVRDRKGTAARYYVQNQREVEQLLRRWVKLLT